MKKKILILVALTCRTLIVDEQATINVCNDQLIQIIDNKGSAKADQKIVDYVRDFK